MPSAWPRGIAAAALLVAGALTTHAALVHTEGTANDLSNLPDQPTPLTLSVGDNEIHGTTGRPSSADPVDRDFFRITIKDRQELSGIDLLDGTGAVGARAVGFIGVLAGNDFGLTPPTSPAALLGYHHYSPTEIGTDILPLIGQGAGALGFTGPLGPGTYAFWVQETGTAVVNYGFNFRISAVPDAGPGLLSTLGAFGLTGLASAGLRRRALRS